jgi:uncharacterized protein with von Willebrand factor type A (vWA) domain
MKRYAPLIRKLVDATAEAEVKGDDIAEIIKERCFCDTDLVRQTIMNAVCDPRFKLFADVVGYWKDEARNALEQLVIQLEKINPLTEEVANSMLDGFLVAWFRMTYKEANNKVIPIDNYFNTEKIESKCTENIDNALDILDELETENEIESQYNTSLHRIKNDDTNDQTLENESSEKCPQESQHSQGRGIGYRPLINTSIQKIEERYLKKIPHSLFELAKRIGRMGERGSYKEGKFLTAGKSDIAGITVGNEIAIVLPSELAILADSMLQNVFYHKFTTRQLQLFASASQSKSSKKHEDGPVIICVDTSSSMEGEPITVAKALSVAVAIIAWRKKRDVIVVKYSDQYHYKNLGHNRNNLVDLARFLSEVTMAGNNENGMFRWLFEEVKPMYTDYNTADILCISDFGWMPLSQETEKIIETEKQKGMKFYGLNVNSNNAYISSVIEMQEGINTPMDICDSVWMYEDGECKEIK